VPGAIHPERQFPKTNKSQPRPAELYRHVERSASLRMFRVVRVEPCVIVASLMNLPSCGQPERQLMTSRPTEALVSP
jgi:hypothetical protein